MGSKDYRARKIEYYGRPMGALNLYIYLLLPVFVVWQAVSFTWRATVASAQFETVTEFLSAFIILVLGAAAWLSVYGVDRYAFFSNIVFLFAAGASRVIQTFFPPLLDGRGGAVSADLQAAVAPAAQAALSISGGLTAFFSSLQEGVAAAAGSSLSIFSGGGMGAMGGMDPSGGMGMAGMGMDGMMGGAQAAGK